MNPIVPFAIAFVALAAVGGGLKKKGGRRGKGYPNPPPMGVGVPFAQGLARPDWPVLTSHDRVGEVAYTDVNGENHGRRSRQFKASRANGARWHAGIDLFANAGDVVVATQSGRLVNGYNFLGTTDALLIQTDTGLVTLYGEIKDKSWKELGLEIGDHVDKGQPIALVGVTPAGSSMLHFETYVRGTTKNESWSQQRTLPPPNLLDPTDYLLRAAQSVAPVA